MAVSKNRRFSLLLLKKFLLLKKKREIRENLEKNRRRKDRRCWVHPIWENRKVEGYFHTLLNNMRIYDHSYFHNFLRMSPEVFDKLVGMLASSLKKYPPSREPLSPAHRLAITLRFLATGDSIMSTAYGFRIGKSTCHYVIKETCDALWNVLQPLYLATPTAAIWREAAQRFGRLWQYPNCVGAVDGKHVAIKQPAKTGSMFYNYKGTNSIVLMAVVDAEYKFLAVDVGAYGSSSDGGIFKSSEIGQALDKGTLGIPGLSTLPRSNIRVPHVLLGDEAFQLRTDFLQPYPGRNLDSKKRVFNYRLSRARRCSENAFGILGARWQVYHRTINFTPDNTDRVVKATVALHNFLMTTEQGQKKKSRVYCPPGYVDFTNKQGTFCYGTWNDEPGNSFSDIACSTARNSSYEATLVRQKYTDYFWSEEEEVPWQWEMPGVTNPRNQD